MKKNDKKYNNAEKKAKNNYNKSIKDYELKLETPIDGVAYFKANLGGVFGKKSQHLKAKIMGIENNNSLLGKSKLMVQKKIVVLKWLMFVYINNKIEKLLIYLFITN